MSSIVSASKSASRIFCIVFGIVICSSCSSDPVASAEVVVSRVHGICASSPGVVSEKNEAGPDFDYGVLASGGEKIEYYSSAQASQRDALLSQSSQTRVRSDGIAVSSDKYSDGKDGVSLSGYENRFSKKLDVKVVYFFASQDDGGRKLAESLATTTQKCKEPARTP